MSKLVAGQCVASWLPWGPAGRDRLAGGCLRQLRLLQQVGVQCVGREPCTRKSSAHDAGVLCSQAGYRLGSKSNELPGDCVEIEHPIPVGPLTEKTIDFPRVATQADEPDCLSRAGPPSCRPMAGTTFWERNRQKLISAKAARRQASARLKPVPSPDGRP